MHMCYAAMIILVIANLLSKSVTAHCDDQFLGLTHSFKYSVIHLFIVEGVNVYS